MLSYHLKEKYVFDCIESVLQQTHQDLILHIVDDTGAEGFNHELRAAFPDPRIRFYKNPKNIGYYHSTNQVFHNFKGELFFVFDSDDISPNWRIADALEIYQKESFDVYTGGIRWITEAGELTERYGIPQPYKFDDWGNPKRGVFFNPSCAVRCGYFKEIRGYSDCLVAGDRDFIFKSYFYRAKIHHDSLRVMAYRRNHPNQVTKDKKTNLKSDFRAKINKQTYDRTLKYYLGGCRRRIRKCGRLPLTGGLEPILI